MDNIIARFPFEQLRKYPHMFADDIAIWERFLITYPGFFDGVDFDVKVGSGTEPQAGLGDKYAKMQAILSRYRIDVVGFKNNSITIVEVKPDAGTIAIGQALFYTHLFQRDYNPTVPIQGMILTNRELPDVREFAKLKGILYYIA